MRYLNFDKGFKIAILLILVSYLIVLNNSQSNYSDKGRYQFIRYEVQSGTPHPLIFDTKTGNLIDVSYYDKLKISR